MLEGAVFSSSLWMARRPGQVSAQRAARYLPGSQALREPGSLSAAACAAGSSGLVFLEMMMTTRFASHPSYTRQSCNGQCGRLTHDRQEVITCAVDPTFLLLTFRDNQGPLKRVTEGSSEFCEAR